MPEPAADTEADSVVRTLRQAVDAHRKGNLAAAELLYERVLGADAERFEVLNNLGIIAAATGRIDRAIELARRAIQSNPRNADAHCNLGYALNLVKHHVEALKYFEAALRLDPNHRAARQNRHEAIADLKQWLLLEAYQTVFGVFPRLNPPITFNEHILHRIIYDRDPRLKVLCNKLAVRKFIRERVGDEYVVPLLDVSENPKRIAWEMLPGQFVVKPSHTSGPVAIVNRSEGFDQQRLISEAEGWLRRDYFDVSLEWGYRGIPRYIIVEPLLNPRHERVPLEAHFFTFSGKVSIIRVLSGRKKSPERKDCWYDRNGRLLAIKREIPNADLDLTAEDREHMVRVAQNIAAGFDSLRVDFYMVKDALKIGELTPYPGGGRVKWDPPDLDEILGRLWNPAFDLSGLPHRG